MSHHTHRELTLFGKIFKVLLPLLFIMGGSAAWSYFQSTAPGIKRGRPVRQATVVETMTAESRDVRPVIKAMGTVTAARQVTLKAQVSGAVQWVSDRFVPGSLVARGEELIRLDPADYKVQVKKAKSVLDDARAALAIEQGSQNIAREELRLLTEMSAQKVAQTDLALRKPQLAQAQADVTGAEADLTQARFNLERTRITAPFNAMIVERSVNLGTYAGTQESLVTLVGTDAFWVEAMVPLDQLPYIDMDYPGGCPATIQSQSGTGTWEGQVIQVSGKLSTASRMATVIVAVKNPLGTRNHPASLPLMIDDYVHVTLTGRTLAHVVALPRPLLQDDDTVWVNHEDTLDIRQVTLAWKGRDQIFIRQGVTPGEEVVASGLAVPVQGMPCKQQKRRLKNRPGRKARPKMRARRPHDDRPINTTKPGGHGLDGRQLGHCQPADARLSGGRPDHGMARQTGSVPGFHH